MTIQDLHKQIRILMQDLISHRITPMEYETKRRKIFFVYDRDKARQEITNLDYHQDGQRGIPSPDQRDR